MDDATRNSKTFFITTRCLSIAAFATSVLACFGAHHIVRLDEGPYVEHLFGIQCQDLVGEGQEYCLNSDNTRYYALWGTFDNFFSIEDYDGGVLCGVRDFDFHVEGDVAKVTEGNLGQCSVTVERVAGAFTVLTALCCSFLIVYITILAEIILHSRHSQWYYTGAVSLMLCILVCSGIAIGVYVLAINPLRLSPTFCQEQTLFEYCEQEMGYGFWFQVATFVMALAALFFSLAWGSSSSSSSRQIIQPIAPVEAHDAFYKYLHYFVQWVRFAELAILICGVATPFTRVHTTIPSQKQFQARSNNENIFLANSATTTVNVTGNFLGNATHRLKDAFADRGIVMDTEINLWQGMFCREFGARLFLWSVLLNELDVQEESFGACEGHDIFHVQIGYIMAMVTAITSLTFQKDAKTMPLAYIVGFIMHFMSMVKLSWAIGAFMLNVFPGRKEIEPSYCSLWTSYLEGATCSIDVGVGLVFTASALATVAVSFIGEVIVQGSHKYGVNTAFRVLVGRVREGRVQDLIKATSDRELFADGDDATGPRDPLEQAPRVVFIPAEQTALVVFDQSNTTKKSYVSSEEDIELPRPAVCLVCMFVVLVFLVVLLVVMLVAVLIMAFYNKSILPPE